MEGTVKNFNKEKGFGFITTEDEKDIFFHYSELQMEGFKTVTPGQEVKFEVEETDRGTRAINITLVN